MAAKIDFKVDVSTLSRDDMGRILDFFLTHGHIDENLLYKTHALLTNQFLLEHVRSLTVDLNNLKEIIEQQQTEINYLINQKESAVEVKSTDSVEKTKSSKKK